MYLTGAHLWLSFTGCWLIVIYRCSFCCWFLVFSAFAFVRASPIKWGIVSDSDRRWFGFYLFSFFYYFIFSFSIWQMENDKLGWFAIGWYFFSHSCFEVQWSILIDSSDFTSFSFYFFWMSKVVNYLSVQSQRSIIAHFFSSNKNK